MRPSPLMVIVEVPTQPRIADLDAVPRIAVMHVVDGVRNHDRDCGEPAIVGGKVCEAQIRRRVDRRPMRYILEADPGNVLAGVVRIFTGLSHAPSR